MNWLVWKDYRVNRLAFITTLVLLVAPMRWPRSWSGAECQ